MRRAGFRSIGVTAESACDEVLRGLGKDYNAHAVRDAARAVADQPLPCLWMFLFGGPGETRDTVRRTLDFARQYLRPHDIAFFNAGIRIYPGTRLEALARAEGSLELSAAEMLAPTFYVSPHVGRSWLLETLSRATAERLNFIGPDSLRHPFLPHIQRLAASLGASPPLWRHARLVRRALRLLGVPA
jgi:radical SAM superfamily enzyme YgiQ (UPF0313 family)